MGVKSTVKLTRQAAEEKYVEMAIERRKRFIRAEAVVMNDEELENILELWNDDKYDDGEGFENYLIIDQHEQSW